MTRAQLVRWARFNRRAPIEWWADWPRASLSPIWWGVGGLAVLALAWLWVRR